MYVRLPVHGGSKRHGCRYNGLVTAWRTEEGERCFDFAIVGAGVSGLSLAWQLLDSALTPCSILLIDGARDEHELRTLSFWAESPGPLDSLVRHRWRSLEVASATGTQRVELLQYSYCTLFFADLQREVKRRLASQPQHLIVEGRLRESTEDAEGVTLSVGAETLRARWVFDSRFHRTELAVDQRRWHLLWQHISGWSIAAQQDVFAADIATLLDFRVAATPGTAFFYVLPFSPREALVELVTLDPVDPEPLLRSYLADVHGLTAFVIQDHEAGKSPMTEQPFLRREGERIRLIGIPAGRLKASTGYALTRILDDGADIVRSLQTHGHPFASRADSVLYRVLDAVLLELWQLESTQIPVVFSALFARNRADEVLRFLDERASLWQILRLIRTLPVWPFLKAVGRCLGRYLRRSNPELPKLPSSPSLPAHLPKDP